MNEMVIVRCLYLVTTKLNQALKAGIENARLSLPLSVTFKISSYLLLGLNKFLITHFSSTACWVT